MWSRKRFSDICILMLSIQFQSQEGLLICRKQVVYYIPFEFGYMIAGKCPNQHLIKHGSSVRIKLSSSELARHHENYANCFSTWAIREGWPNKHDQTDTSDTRSCNIGSSQREKFACRFVHKAFLNRLLPISRNSGREIHHKKILFL